MPSRRRGVGAPPPLVLVAVGAFEAMGAPSLVIVAMGAPSLVVVAVGAPPGRRCGCVVPPAGPHGRGCLLAHPRGRVVPPAGPHGRGCLLAHPRGCVLPPSPSHWPERAS